MASDDVVFEVKMDRRTYENLRRNIRVRALASEGVSLIDAFVYRFIACVDEGMSSYYFKQKKEIE